MRKTKVAVAKNGISFPDKRVNFPPTIVSASVLGQHLVVSRQYVGQLVADGVIRRSGDGYDIDRCRGAYIEHLRRAPKSSARAVADARFQTAKAQLVELRIAERQGVLMLGAEVFDVLDELVGLFRSGLGSLPMKIAGRSDRKGRARIETLCNEILQELSDKAAKFAEATQPTAADGGKVDAGDDD